MKFEEAIKFGKATLDGTEYVEFNEDGVLVDEKGNEQYFNKEYLTSTDWDVFEEKKTLGDKVYFGKDCSTDFMYFDKDDVKEALKEYRDWVFKNTNCSAINEHPIAKEIFGEEMLE